MIIEKREDITRMIKAACALQGATVTELGRRLGVVNPSISRTVNRSDLRLSQLDEIAKALNCDLYINLLPKGTRATENGERIG